MKVRAEARTIGLRAVRRAAAERAHECLLTAERQAVLAALADKSNALAAAAACVASHSSAGAVPTATRAAARDINIEVLEGIDMAPLFRRAPPRPGCQPRNHSALTTSQSAGGRERERDGVAFGSLHCVWCVCVQVHRAAQAAGAHGPLPGVLPRQPAAAAELGPGAARQLPGQLPELHRAGASIPLLPPVLWRKAASRPRGAVLLRHQCCWPWQGRGAPRDCRARAASRAEREGGSERERERER